MPDSTWQQGVLRDLGVSQRGLRVLDPAASQVQPAWGADAPPLPVPEPQPSVTPGVMPEQVQAASQPPPAPVQPAVEPPPPPPPPPVFSSRAEAPSQGDAEPPPPPPAETPSQGGAESPPPPPPPVFPQGGEVSSQGDAEVSPPPPPPPMFPPGVEAASQRDAASSPSREDVESPVPVEAPPEQPQPDPAPQTHFDYDWAAAVNPLVGVDTADAPAHPAPEHAAAGPSAPAATEPHAQPQQAQGVAGAAVPAAEELVRKNQHGDPLARRMGRSVRKAVGGGSREAREMGAFLELMRTPVPGSRQIAVASVRGGAGKTTMAALVATELARYRQDRVLAADADAELGSLPLRLGVRTQLSLFDLAGQNPRTFEEAARFLARTPEGLFVLSSTRGGRIAGEFTLEMFQGALNVVGRYVGTTVVDCGAGILTELNRGVVASSHGLVLVTPGTVDGALSARGALEWYAGNDQQDLLRRTVIAMVSHAPQVGADLHRAHQMLTSWGLPVVFVPYDRHLATGSSVDMSKVSAAARASVTRVVHEVFARALSAGTGR
ncbi:hypothetical protein GCM10009736_46180 [Actinomadura bangladeshensis]